MAHTDEWYVRLYLYEEEGTTTARAVLNTGTSMLTGRGVARCNPHDVDVPEIGDELAAGRAVDELARQLMGEVDRGLQSVGAGRLDPQMREGYIWPGPPT